jgi:hypothetical protein
MVSPGRLVSMNQRLASRSRGDGGRKDGGGHFVVDVHVGQSDDELAGGFEDGSVRGGGAGGGDGDE